MEYRRFCEAYWRFSTMAWKKQVCVLLAGCLLLFTAACSNQKEISRDGSAATPDPRVSFKLFMSDLSLPLPDKGIQGSAFMNYLSQRTNTNVHLELLSNSQYNEKIRLKFATGDIPDVYETFGMSRNAETITNGQAMDLNDLIDLYGPNLKKAIPSWCWDQVKVDGKIMAIPEVPKNSGSVFYVRKDWMDRLGIRHIPQTSEELLDLFRAFRDKDPNGNGEKDEIAFSLQEDLSGWNNILGMWGLGPHTFRQVGEEIIPSVIDPNMKSALAYLKKMNDESLLDPDFLTNTSPIFQQKIISGQIGSFSDQPSRAAAWDRKLKSAAPADRNPSLIAIPTPHAIGYNGPVGAVNETVNKIFIVMKSAEHPEAIIKFFDWLASSEGQRFASMGIEGDTYHIDGERYVYDYDKDTDNKSAIRSGLFYLFPSSEIEQKMLKTPIQQLSDDKINEASELAKKEGLYNPTESMPTPRAYLDHPELKYSGSLFQEIAGKIVLGNAPLDSFDDYVKFYREHGGNDLIKEVTEWVNKNSKK